MSGLDCLGATEIGMEGTDLAKMFGGLLSGTGGILASGGGKKGDDAAAAAEQKRLADEKRKAEQSAATMKKVAIGAGAVALGVGGFYFLKVRKK